MDELHGFCVRMLGPGEAAEAAMQAGREAAGGDRLQELAAAAVACRTAVDGDGDGHREDAAEAGSLAAAVARELSAASARLPERQREALALRESLGLSYEELGAVVGIDPAAVGPLLARARLRLRVELRGEGPPPEPCDERDRALSTIARRQDGEPVPEADDDWLIEHLGHCVECGRAHAAMLEASVCYRAWRLDEADAES